LFTALAAVLLSTEVQTTAITALSNAKRLERRAPKGSHMTKESVASMGSALGITKGSKGGKKSKK
jgi:hypothetical protein